MIWVYISLITVGFFPFLILMYKINKRKKIKELGIKTMATVKNSPFHSYRKLSQLNIEYTVQETGRLISKTLFIAGNLYQQGEEIPIYYKKEKPEKMVLDSDKKNTVGIVFSLLIAAFLIAACVLISQGIASGEL